MRIINSDQTVLHGDIVHYRYTLAVGPGQFDKVRLHRVVKESHPYWPVRTVDAVLLLPGSPNYFEAIFMEPPALAAIALAPSLRGYRGRGPFLLTPWRNVK